MWQGAQRGIRKQGQQALVPVIEQELAICLLVETQHQLAPAAQAALVPSATYDTQLAADLGEFYQHGHCLS